MSILTLQKRARSLGRIRIGAVVPTTRRDGSQGTRPEKLDRFRLTSASKPLLERVAELYGGEVKAWTPQGGGAAQWEVITDSTRLPIMVPPQPVSQFLETWGGGLCRHRCDGYTNVLTGEPCDPDDPQHLEARPTTRLNVVLREVEGIGVWRLETKGWNAAMELPDAAEFLAQVGGYVNGWLSLEERTSVAIVNDKPATRRFMVPIIEIDVTPAELMAGGGRVQAPAIEGPVPVTPAAIEGPGAPAAVVDLAAYGRAIAKCGTSGQLRDLWNAAVERGELTEDVKEMILMAKSALDAPQPDAEGVVDAVLVDPDAEEDLASTAGGTGDDADAVWTRVLALTGLRGMSLDDTNADFADRFGFPAGEATAQELLAYLDALNADQAVA